MKKWILPLIFLFSSLAAEEDNATLQATIHITATSPKAEVNPENFGKMLPGSRMKINTIVKNTGKAPNLPGTISVRFVFPEPLDSQPNSLLFQTETLSVPAITPNQEVNIEFPLSNTWPSLFDFIRQDWGMRQFQAVFTSGEEENVIGTLSIVFSAYYYEGPQKEVPTQVPSIQKEEPSKSTSKTHLRPSRSRQFRKQRFVPQDREISQAPVVQ